MKKILEIALGIVTSVGGFLEIGSITTAAQAGADFSLQLIWAIVLGGLCIIFLVEQAGRFTAVSGRTIPDAIRERFGFNYFAFLYLTLVIVTLLVLAAEIGGVCIALELATGIGLQWWALPAAFVIWLVIWKGTFRVIEKGVSMLGLITLCFVVGAFVSHPPWGQVLRSAVPSLPHHDAVHYWFIAVSILGASISPYLFFFYSSGAIEDEWRETHVGINRVIATGGMTFGSVISIAVLILAAMIFAPRGMKVEHYSQLPDLLVPVFGHTGLVARRFARYRMHGSGDGDHAADRLSDRAGVWLELEQEPATAGRSALQFCLHGHTASRRARCPYRTRSVERDDRFDGPDSGDSSRFDCAVSLSDERRQLCALLSQRLDLQCSRDSDNRPGVCAGCRVHSFADFRSGLMDLVKDCLDKQLEDRNHRRMGRVDGLILELDDGRPPRVAYVEVGVKTLLDRLSRRLGDAVARLLKRFGIDTDPYRIPWGKLHVGLNIVRADVEAEKTPALEWEIWLRKKVINRIPGA